jgi:hypothetical protein
MNHERKAYATRVKLPGWNIRPSLGFEMGTATRRRIICKLLPMTADQYRDRASYHAGREMIARDNYRRAVRAAFGFDPNPFQYRVSAVWSDSLSAVEKARLRRWNAAINYHTDMKRAFEAATKYRRAA